MKRLVGCLIALCMVVAFLPGGQAAAQTGFTDITGHWASQDILKLQAAGYIAGFPDNTFRPDQPMTRAGFVTALVSCLGGTKGSSSTSSPFKDTKGHWALASINQAVKLGIVVTSEYPNGFGPNNPIKRSEAAAMLVRAKGQQPETGTLNFKDADEIDRSMYKGYIKRACSLGLISGYSDGTFRPFASLTRAQTCAILTRMLGLSTSTSTNTGSTGTSTTGGTGTSSTVSSGDLTVITIGSHSYNINQVPVYLRTGGKDVRIYNLKSASGTLMVNMAYTYPLSSQVSNLYLLVYNNLYQVSTLTVSGSSLLATVTSQQLTSLTVDGYKYNAEFLQLYTDDTGSTNYLEDASIIDDYTIKIGSKTYDLRNQEVVIAPSSKFYRIDRVLLGSGETTFDLTETSAIYIKHPSLGNIDRIYVDSSRVSFNSSSADLYFFIAGYKYELSDVIIDKSGNFTAGGSTYPPSKVTLVLNDSYYQLKTVSLADDLFTFYCTSTDTTSWIKINDKYYSADDVKIIRDGVTYDVDDVAVVSTNLVRIGNKQYDLDSTFKVKYDGGVYYITKIKYDTSTNLVNITTGDKTTSTGTTLPSNYRFYEDSTLYQSGTSSAYIYAGGEWVEFDNLTSIDPTQFTYDGDTYDLIGAKVKINSVTFKVTDAIWRGSSERFEIYMERY